MSNITQEELGFYIRPLGYRILIRAPKIPEKTSSGLILTAFTTEDAEKRFAIGKVLAFGDSAFSAVVQDFRVNVGDWIQYSKYEREPFLLDNDTLCYYINDDRLLGVIEHKDLPQFSKFLME